MYLKKWNHFNNLETGNFTGTDLPVNAKAFKFYLEKGSVNKIVKNTGLKRPNVSE